MNLKISNGKKYKDSFFCSESFEKLKKDESNRRLLYDILLILFFIIIEMAVFYVISK